MGALNKSDDDDDDDPDHKEADDTFDKIEKEIIEGDMT